jgi:hypothetical protein
MENKIGPSPAEPVRGPLKRESHQAFHEWPEQVRPRRWGGSLLTGAGPLAFVLRNGRNTARVARSR